ncbi:MAG: PAS domain S-box protein, partial [Pseudomonadota bacterium]|nr:PAS domain S-box protein [Pseudomonadota bacterium]
IENHELLVRTARELSTHTLDRDGFLRQADTFTRDHRETTNLLWLQPSRLPVAAYSGTSFPPETGISGIETPGSLPIEKAHNAPEEAFERARDSRLTAYSKPFPDSFGNTVFQEHIPLFDRSGFRGALVAEYSIERLMRYQVPEEIARKHAVSIVDAHGQTLASTVLSNTGQHVSSKPQLTFDLPVAPADNGLVLRSQGYRTSIGLLGNMLFWMVMLLSALTVWMLLGTWRHMRRRLQMQAALVSETNFRRAMENSMLTGMRAMDLEGRVSYVNPAFCAMTGFAEAELIGLRPPFPYWPHDRRDENARLLTQELEGKSPVGGIEVKVMRKDGSIFDARMYVSPLIDPKGHQTGWMTSMTNITEAKRIRDQLSASHERFTTVLEGLDTAVSVLSMQSGELLFANRSYRLWFGADAKGHGLLAGGEAGPLPGGEADDAVDGLGGLPTQELTTAGSDSREVYVESLGKWFDVRARYLQWTDGRLTQMVIATDISERRRAEAVAASQAEKAQVTSRLVTMGEMASSVAHELNQPLTAITNYCNGIVTRVENNAIDKPDLIAALQKTSRQAERTGQIIHRIRAFVKRSEPQRVKAEAQAIVDDAVDLAGIELRRRNVAISTYVAPHLPPLMVDPILIEQVVLNLLKNAAEAIDNAKLLLPRRRIELRVVPRRSVEEGEVVEFTVTDKGPGLKDEVIARMYEAFFSTKVDGLGIGLSLCRTIIESHRGRIKAHNLYNGDVAEGCCFSFSLPVEIAAPVVARGPATSRAVA